MLKKTVLFTLTCLGAAAVGAEDARSVLEKASKAMGSVTSLQYSGSGMNFAVGQSPRHDAPWPKFNVLKYQRSIDYGARASREELFRTQGENPPRGGGGQPLQGEQRQLFLVSGAHAWNMAGENPTPAPAAANERALQILLTPHGFIQGALSASATLKSETRSGKKVSVVSFTALDKFKVTGVIDDRGFVIETATSIDNPVLGDMPIESTFSDYKDFGGVQFPTRILQKQGGFPALDLTVADLKPNAGSVPGAPDAVKQATAPSVKVEAQKVSDGVWYFTGGSHHSAAVEFKDHVVVIEGPQNDERSLAVIAEVKKTAPGKPIKYLLNTHHHFDHSGGIRAYMAEGATLITHETNKPYYARTFAAPRTLNPDALARSGKKATIETVGEKRVLADATRTLEIHLMKGNPHNEALLMVYLPAEKILIEADAFTPGPPNAPPPATPNPFSVNLYENIQRLKLDVNQIMPIHGRLTTLAELMKAIKKAPTE